VRPAVGSPSGNDDEESRIFTDMNRAAIEQILDLPPTERLEIVQEIWESLRRDEDVPVTPAQRVELERIWDEFQKDPEEGEPWEEFRKSLPGR
jgi:putative addiction module component (TIGR02574 family)